ncbi:LOW QUALITY PROTEIN: hypothetical protein M513_13787 [Trichuris suis]|uniref:Uncharacterized protein n=1 Tax=Trichuris suis TaxID=68888 RepID=A0A085LK40_9BILA|nr:LOW QUALITY PROTEIN: hypothetical protein M513_13787 [Trichuris suis]
MQPPVVGTSGKDANSVIITFENVKPKWMRKLPFLMEKNWNPPDVRKREKKNSCKEDGKTNETLVALLLKCWNGGWKRPNDNVWLSLPMLDPLSLPAYGVKTKRTNRVRKMITKRTICGRIMSLVTFCTMKKEEDQQKEVKRTIECDDFHSGPVSIRLINPRIEYHGYGIRRCSICD